MSGTYLTFDLAKLRKMGGSLILNGQYTPSMKHLKALEAEYGEFSTRTPIHPDCMGDGHTFSEGSLTFGPLADIVSHRDDYADLNEASKADAVHILVKDITDTTALHLIVAGIESSAAMLGLDAPALYLSTGDKSAKLN